MASPSDITIVIPVKNREVLILRCLDSVAAQTVMPAEVIVVDNGSTDGTVSAVESWGALHPDIPLRILSESTPGAAAARNKGLDSVKTEYVYFLDSDDEMLPSLLQKSSAAIGEADLICWKAVCIGLNGKKRQKPFHIHHLIHRQFYNAVLSTQVYLARTSLIREVGKWNEKALVWNDWELGIRIAIAGPKCKSLPENLIVIHSQADSITGPDFSHKEGEWEKTFAIVARDILDSPLNIRQKKLLLDLLSYRKMILAATYRKEKNLSAARKLMKEIESDARLGTFDRLRLKLLYHYTALGGRGAYYFWK